MTPYKQGPPSEFREGEIKTGIARSFAAKTPSTASSPWPFEDSLRALAIKTRMGRRVGAWWRRPQARKEHSSPTLPSPGGLTPKLCRLTLYCPCRVRGRGRVVPSRRPGLAPPGWFGHGIRTCPSSGTAVSDRWPVTWRPSVSRTAGSGDPRRTKQIRSESSRDQRAVKTNFAACQADVGHQWERQRDSHDGAREAAQLSSIAAPGSFAGRRPSWRPGRRKGPRR